MLQTVHSGGFICHNTYTTVFRYVDIFAQTEAEMRMFATDGNRVWNNTPKSLIKINIWLLVTFKRFLPQTW